MTSIFVGVYWRARPEELTACAVKLERHFAMLAETAPSLATWFRRGGRKPRPDQALEPAAANLERTLAKSVNRTDIGKIPILELGWSLGVWNGGVGGLEASTSVHCGFHGKTRGLSNSAYVSIGPREDAVWDTPSMPMGLLKRLIEIWEPEKGVIRRQDGAEAATELASYTTSPWRNPIKFGRTEHLKRGRIWIAPGAALD